MPPRLLKTKPLFNHFFPSEIVAAITQSDVDFKLRDDQHDLDPDQKKYLERELNIKLDNVITIRQVHGDSIVCADKNYLENRSKADEADAIITQEKNVAICVRTADCIPLFIFDPQIEVIAVVHAGWKGVHVNIAGKTINFIKKNWDTDPSQIKVALGPSARECCYEVGAEFRNHFPHDLKESHGKLYLDLVSVCKRQLFKEGIEIRNIIEEGGCTVCQSKWHSFRRDKEKAGRMISLMMMS